MKVVVILLSLITLVQCRGDETIRAYGAADHVWVATELNGAPFDADATLTFPEPGRIAGQSPCNSYSADMTVPYPWFEVQNLVSTKKACPDLPAETAFFDALKASSLSEVSGPVLELSTPEGLSLIFKARD